MKKTEEEIEEKKKNPTSDAKLAMNEFPCSCGNCKWTNTDNTGPEYLEIEVLPDTNTVATTLIQLAQGISKKLQIDMHWILEGQNGEELPENILSSLRFCNIDLSHVTVLD